MEKEYSPFYWHNKALREHPEYQREGMLDCLREEIMMNMPAQYNEQVYQKVEQPEDHYYVHKRNFNINIDPKYTSSRLYRRVENLEAQVVFLKKLLNKASASKRKPKTKY